nr:hypothetical protein [Bradyrhizobium sp. 169]
MSGAAPPAHDPFRKGPRSRPKTETGPGGGQTNTRSPDDDLPTDWHAYPVYLTNEKKLAPRSVQVTVAALRFLYRATLGLDWDFDQIIQCAKGAKDTGLHSQP